MDRPSSPLAGEPFSTIRQRHCPPPCPAGSARSVPRLAKPGAAKSGAALARDWAAPGGPPAPAQDPQARWQANHFLPTDTGTARPLPGRVSPKRPPPGKARRGKERGGSGPRLGGSGRPPCPGARPSSPLAGKPFSTNRHRHCPPPARQGQPEASPAWQSQARQRAGRLWPATGRCREAPLPRRKARATRAFTDSGAYPCRQLLPVYHSSSSPV